MLDELKGTCASSDLDIRIASELVGSKQTGNHPQYFSIQVHMHEDIYLEIVRKGIATELPTPLEKAQQYCKTSPTGQVRIKPWSQMMNNLKEQATVPPHIQQ